MEKLADFKRLARPGSVWHCENYLHPHVSGERRITKGKSVLHYAFTKADGTTGTNGRLEFPKASEVRFVGNSAHFLNGDEVAYTWTLVREAVS